MTSNPTTSTLATSTPVTSMLASIAALIGLLGVSGCSDPDRSASRFCGELAVELPLLGGPFTDGNDVDDLVGRYEKLEAITPLAIETEWRALTELIRVASEVDASDPASQQFVADTAYKTERAARDVAIWVETTCGIPMPDVVGVEGSVPVSIPAPIPEPATESTSESTTAP